MLLHKRGMSRKRLSLQSARSVQLLCYCSWAVVSLITIVAILLRTAGDGSSKILRFSVYTLSVQPPRGIRNCVRLFMQCTDTIRNLLGRELHKLARTEHQ